MAKPASWLRYTAQAIALLWAGWWTFFGLASGIGEGLSLPGILLHTLAPGLIFMLTAVVACCWEKPGGIVLILEGLLTLESFPFATTAPGLLTLTLPPIAAGILFIAEPHHIGMRGSPPPGA